MPTLLISLRVLCVIAFVAPMLLLRLHQRHAPGPPAIPAPHAARRGTERAPLLANLAGFGLYLPALPLFARSRADAGAVTLAVMGSLLALVGAAVVCKARLELGRAWSLLPEADPQSGFVTAGPYRWVRHPIYLGLILVTTGTALAWGSAVACCIVVLAIVPTFIWRARTEETLLSRTFGESYAAYRRRTRLLLPLIL
jgi:protein-S-isoprenylcysteine O-methyltransferase Ste14